MDYKLNSIWITEERKEMVHKGVGEGFWLEKKKKKFKELFALFMYPIQRH